MALPLPHVRMMKMPKDDDGLVEQWMTLLAMAARVKNNNNNNSSSNNNKKKK
jgi:hypothetical protein